MNESVSVRTKLSIIAVAMLTFTGILIETSLNVTFPTLMRIFGKSLSTVQLLTTGYLLMVSLVMGSTAFLLKRFKAKKLFMTAISLALLGLALCFIATNFWILMLGRLLQATSTGIATPLMFSVIFNKVPEKRWGTYSGIAAMLISIAPAIGPSYGGIMNHYFSWRMIFAFVFMILLIALMIGIINFEDNSISKNEKFDTFSFVLLIIFLIAFEFSIQQLGYNLLIALFLALLGIVFLIVFIKRSLRKKQPLLDLRILKNKYLSLRLGNYVILQFVNIASSFIIPIFAETFLHVNSLVAGLVLLPASLLGACVAPFAGKWYDDVGPNYPILVGNTLMTLGIAVFVILTDKLTVPLIIVFYVLVNLGFNMTFGNVMTDAGKVVLRNQKADQNSLFSMSQQYAGSIGTAVMASVITIVGNESTSSYEAIKLGGHLGFVILLILAVIGLICALILRKKN
ncbi:MFS transporter [Ligilactobacillus sp. WILCCON 0076]|uniref:MFS transporter n=1 Tax=Ligilactobacillus ubinensis TaxID=2876789 RepID=A0A9X2FML9_9LACO|nr:MFS transporter [Ligilactobacillus ubinensis]MCP0887331.1 MFS transporter [Ligilactobacillus ubinensis]